jgi:hypothetical protein
MFHRLFTLCSARVSALMIVLSDSPCDRIWKWESMSEHTNHENTTSTKRSSGRKSKLTERDRRILRRTVSKKTHNYCSKVEEGQELNAQHETLFTQKLSDVSFINPTSTVGLQLLNLWLLKVMLRCICAGGTTINPGHQTTGNSPDMVRWVALRAVPYIKKSLRFGNNQGSLQSGMPVKHRGGSVMVWAAISWYSVLLVPLFPFRAELLHGSTWKGWVNQEHPMIQVLFPNNDAVFHDDNSPIHKAATSSLASTITRFDHHWTIVVSFGDKSEEQILASNISKLFFFVASGVGLSPLYCGHFWPIVPAPDDRWGWLWSNWWNEDWQGKSKYTEKTCPSATLFTSD